MLKPIVITAGEPAGIGPDILLLAAAKALPHPIVAVANIQLLRERAAQLNLQINFVEYHQQPITQHQPGVLPVLDVPLAEISQPGVLSITNVPHVMSMLRLAGEMCLDKQFSALVTCPVQKSIINDAGITFSGHTEFFAQLCNTPNIVMMLANKQLKVALMTTHLPLSAVSDTITQQLIIDNVKIIHADLIKKFSIKAPKILMCGLNPHAGEAGHLGTQELTIINPAAALLRSQGIDISDAIPADTAFTKQYREQADIIIAMYHDQGLPVIKALGFGECTNMTLGLPIIRTSVDHGTALSLAGTGKANADSLYQTILLTAELINSNE